jgi:hypothetical protein
VKYFYKYSKLKKFLLKDEFMRKQYLLILILLLVLCIITISFVLYKNWSALNTSAETSYNIDIKKLEKEMLDEEGEKFAEVIQEYPIISNLDNNEFINTINEKYKSEAEASFIELQKQFNEMLPYVKEQRESGYFGEDLFYSEEITISIPYNKDGIISIAESIYYFTGGAHPSLAQSSKTYDLKTGKELNITDILNISKEEVKQLVIEKFNEKINEAPEMYFEGELEKNADNVEFYLAEGKLVLYFNEYIISPHVTGMPSVEIDYSILKL